MPLVLAVNFWIWHQSKDSKAKINIKSFCTAMETTNKMKRQPTKREKIFVNHISNKELISKITRSWYNSIEKKKTFKKWAKGDFPGGPVVKNLPSNAGGAGLIPGRGTKIPHAMGQLSPHHNYWAHMPQWESPRSLELTHHNYRAHVPWSPCTTTRERKPACHN